VLRPHNLQRPYYEPLVWFMILPTYSTNFTIYICIHDTNLKCCDIITHINTIIPYDDAIINDTNIQYYDNAILWNSNILKYNYKAEDQR